MPASVLERSPEIVIGNGRLYAEPLSEEEIDTLVAQAIESANAQGMQDMGRVMGALKSDLQGRADMAAVSAKVKQLLSE